MNLTRTAPQTDSKNSSAERSPAPLVLSRRSAIASASIAALATSLGRSPRAWAAESAGTLPYMDRLGLQLYTVRNQMAENKDATLTAVAEAGYKQIELMDVSEEGLQIASIARDKGLSVHSGFINWEAITNPSKDGVASIDDIIAMGERIGLRHLVFGYIGRGARDTADKCKRIAEAANIAAEKTRTAGMRMCYHNHSFEFAKFAGSEQTAYDIFMKDFDPKWMEFELDVFWVKIGGYDPIAMMERLAGRITQVHLKDLKQGVGVITDEGKVPKDAFQEVGDGTIDMPQVMRLAKKIGVSQCHVEQDQSPDPLASIAQSAAYLREQV